MNDFEKEEAGFFAQLLEKIFSLFSGECSEKEQINDMLNIQGESSSEKDVISIICEEIDDFHEEMIRMEDEDVEDDEIGAYLNSTLVAIAQENNPNMSKTEKVQLPDLVEKILQVDIENVTDEVVEESAGNTDNF